MPLADEFDEMVYEPSEAFIESEPTNVHQFMQEYGISDYDELIERTTGLGDIFMNSGSYSPFLRAWTRSSSLLFNSFVETNRAAVAAFGISSDEEEPTEGVSSDQELAEARITPASDLVEWDIERSIQNDGSLSAGDTIQFSKMLSKEDVVRFATASGDTNSIHLDAERAEETRFDGRIVHGTLVSGLISAALARLPGDVIYLSQDIEFLNPVRIGDHATAVIEVAEDFGGDRYRFTTQVLDAEDEIAIDGEATVLLDDPPE
jgi:3-hydroxybutyryl-CoA dehydratase